MSVVNFPEDGFRSGDAVGSGRGGRDQAFGGGDAVLGGGCRAQWGGGGSMGSAFNCMSSVDNQESGGVGGVAGGSLPDFELPHRRSDSLSHSPSPTSISSFYHDQATKLRCPSTQTNPMPDHVPQVTAPVKPRSSLSANGLNVLNNGGGGGSGGSNGVSGGSSAYPSSSDESTSGRHSPIAAAAADGLTGLCKDFAGLNTGNNSNSSDAASTLTGNGSCSRLGGGGGGPITAIDIAREDMISRDLIHELSQRTGYQIVQRNGQRIFGPPPNWTEAPPTKGCEVFVGRVPRDCFEPELVPVFSKVGPIYELRLMMDFSGSNRGFFFVRYTCREDAKRAVAELDNFQIRPNKRLGVLMSMDNNKLWISGIPNNVTADDIRIEIERLTEGVKDVILYRSQTDKSKPRKYAFVEYSTHRAAALARRRLVPAKILIKGQEIEKVDWAEPQNEVDEETMSTVKVLFVRNLAECTSEESLRRCFEVWSGGCVERVKKSKDYAFVHLSSRQAAEEAKRSATGQVIDGEAIEVEWSKPVDKNIYNTRKYLTKMLQQPPPTSPAAAAFAPHQEFCMPRIGGGGFHAGLMEPVSPMMNRGGFDGLRGAPCTPPPRNLLRRLQQAGIPSSGPVHGLHHYQRGGNGPYHHEGMHPLPHHPSPPHAQMAHHPVPTASAAAVAAAAALMSSNYVRQCDTAVIKALKELEQQQQPQMFPAAAHQSVNGGVNGSSPPQQSAFGGGAATVQGYFPPSHPGASAGAGGQVYHAAPYLNPFFYQSALAAAQFAAHPNTQPPPPQPQDVSPPPQRVPETDAEQAEPAVVAAQETEVGVVGGAQIE